MQEIISTAHFASGSTVRPMWQNLTMSWQKENIIQAGCPIDYNILGRNLNNHQTRAETLADTMGKMTPSRPWQWTKNINKECWVIQIELLVYECVIDDDKITVFSICMNIY